MVSKQPDKARAAAYREIMCKGDMKMVEIITELVDMFYLIVKFVV